MPLTGRTILVVDDEEGLREILIEEFSYFGATVIGVGSGNAAFELLRTRNFDAVISDVLMRDGDGPSLIHKINATLKPVPKLFLCTGFSDLTKEQIRGLNVTAVFEKPFARDHVVETVTRALRPELSPVK